jgi:hypothetical protein
LALGKKKEKTIEGFVMFDVLYADGTKSSRRKVPAALIAEKGEDHALTAIMDQDRKIMEMSGNDRGPIASVLRSE